MNKVLILDFGSQYTQLIARRIREENVFCEIHPPTMTLRHIVAFEPQAIILSGGPSSVTGKGAPKVDAGLFKLGLPVLGICYGMQLMVHLLGGRLAAVGTREYGKANLALTPKTNLLLDGLPQDSTVWMSHGDSIQKMPAGFQAYGVTDSKMPCALGNSEKHLYALQFHPEVRHTGYGSLIIRNFLFKISKLEPDWTMSSFIKEEIARIRNRVGDDRVILGLSGGVDSTVAAVLIHQAIGKQLVPLFINNGLLRLNEAAQVRNLFKKHFKIPLHSTDASKLFLRSLKGVSDPEKKRKIIGKTFIQVFEASAKKFKKIKFLAQGTLYPDVIESVSFKGPSATIKSHHNVGGLPKRMGLKLLEPFRELFKDEVRELGKQLNIPDEILGRHPFPGPGLAVRILGDITPKSLSLLRQADHIFIEELKKNGLYDQTWQAFAVLLPVMAVGVMGDQRTYENVCALRAVKSVDGMTADWADLPHEFLGMVARRIINQVRGINRVAYDISSKPPATIEWE